MGKIYLMLLLLPREPVVFGLQVCFCQNIWYMCCCLVFVILSLSFFFKLKIRVCICIYLCLRSRLFFFSAFVCLPFCDCCYSHLPSSLWLLVNDSSTTGQQQCASIHFRHHFSPHKPRKRRKAMSLLWFCYSMLCGNSSNLVERVKDVKRNEFMFVVNVRVSELSSIWAREGRERKSITRVCIYNI